MSNSLSLEDARADLRNEHFWQSLSCCPLCGRSAFAALFAARDRHYGNAGVFPVVECESCKLWFLNPMPTMAYLSGAYPSDYYSYSPPPLNDLAVMNIQRTKKLVRRLVGFQSGRTGDPKFLRPGKVLDVGCGAGAFLLELRDNHWDVHGVELSLQAAARGRAQGLDIFGGTIEQAQYPDSTFDYIRSNHSFEHIHNPREVLREMRRTIKPNGLIFIGVPNVKGLMSRLFGNYWWYLGAPVHTSGYSPETLQELLKQEGFRVVKVNYNSTFGGVFGSLQIFLNRDNGRSSDEGWVFQNRAMRLLGHWIARWTDFFRTGDCIEVIAEPLPDVRQNVRELS